MHADERNRAMSEALGEDVYHYHLHVVYIPVVEKQILWSKRCKDEFLRGTVKETITQVSRSKKWESKPVLNEDGNPMLNAKGKKILKSSYSVLQDDFFNFMRNAGYTDVERGECVAVGLVADGHRQHQCHLERCAAAQGAEFDRSEERRVGKECRSRWSPYH